MNAVPERSAGRLSPSARSACTVKRLSAGEECRWDDYVSRTAGGTFYHLAGWKQLIEDQLHHPAHYLYSERDGEIEAVLPLVHVKSLLFGNALISTPFLVYGGPVASNDEAMEAVVSQARELAQELNVDYLELRNPDPLDGDWATKSSAATFRRRIEAEPEANLMAIPRKQRAVVRKGIKAGLQAEIDDDIDRLYACMLACKRNLGTPFFGARWLRAIKEQFAEQVEITTITHQGRAVCSVMSFRYSREILPYYGGGGALARDLKGNDFMYWAVLEKACKDGVEIFDFGRSTVGSGSYRFKKHWGFEPQSLAYQYFMVNAGSVPNLNPANPRYQLLIRAWKNLPLPVAGIVGPAIARRIG